MKPAWIHLECPDCGEVWESTLAAVPALGEEFACPYCQEIHPAREFVKTQEGLKILEKYQW